MTETRPASPITLSASPFASPERSGAQVMCEALVREKVEVMFGIPGGAIMPFYHAMWEYRDLPSVFHEAFHIARSGRPGPVLIDVTKDAQQARVVPDWNVTLNAPGLPRAAGSGKREAVRQAARLLANASKPLILAGQGVIISGATN